MSDPYGTYPSAQASFYNSQAMMPHSGGRVAPQVPTSGDLAAAFRTQQIMGMHGGALRPGMSRIDAEQYAISQHYNNVAGPGNPFVTTARGINSMLHTASMGAGLYTSAVSASQFAANKFGATNAANLIGKASLSSLASSAAGSHFMGSRALSLGLRGLAGITTLPATLAIMAGTYTLGKAIDRYDTRRQELIGNQELFNAQNFSGSQLADINGNMGVSARREVNQIIANNTIDKYGVSRGMGFKSGELNSVASYAAQNNLLEGYTGSSSQVAGRIMSLAKVAKDIVKLGANISAGEAMELQRITTSMGIQNTELTSGNLGKKLVSAAKASNMSLMEMAGKASEAGAQYMSMGFSAAQGMKLSAHATIGAKSLVGSGIVTGEALAGFGGSQGLENALFRSGTIAMQNNSQTMAMAAMKLRNGKLEVDHGILRDYYTGNLSVDDLQLMAKRNMNSLMKADVNPQDRIKMLAQIQRDMPGMIKNLSSNMSSEQQMALAGQSILSMAKDSGSIGAAMDEYFGEDTQAREAFSTYASNFKNIRSAQNKLDRRVEIEKYKSALAADGEGKIAEGLGFIGRGIEHSIDFLSEYTIDPFIERSLKKEKIALDTAAGYYGGEYSGSVLAMLEGTSGDEIRAVDSANVLKYKGKLAGINGVYSNTTNLGNKGTMFSGLIKDLAEVQNTSSSLTAAAASTAAGKAAGISTGDDYYKAAQKRGLRIGRYEDTGIITGDAGQDLLDRISGRFYSDSTTNSLLNIFGLGAGTDGEDAKEALLTMGYLGDMAIAGRNNILASSLQSRIESSAGSKDGAFYENTRQFKEDARKALRHLAGNDSYNISKNQSFIEIVKILRNSAKSRGISDEDMNVLINSVANEGIEGTDEALKRGSGLLKEMQADILNSFDATKLITGSDTAEEAALRNTASITKIQKEVEGVVGLEKSLGREGLKGLFNMAALTNNQESQDALKKVLGGDDAGLRAFLAKKNIYTDSVTAPQLTKIRALLSKVADGKIDSKVLYGLSNIDLLMAKGQSAEDAVGIQKAHEDMQSISKTLASSSDEHLQKLGQFLAPNGADDIVKGFSEQRHLTLEGIAGKNISFTAEQSLLFKRQLNEINKLEDPSAKSSKLKQLLTDIATAAGSTGTSSTKDAKNMEQVMDQISQGLSTFNTTMTTIANNISNNKPVEIKLSK